jgi:hypothetical protein
MCSCYRLLCKCCLAVAILAFIPILSQAQISPSHGHIIGLEKVKKPSKRNGEPAAWYVHWGYSRDRYTPADIHFTGPGIDFTLLQVRARDMPMAFDPAVHLNPGKFTIPQFNARFGRDLPWETGRRGGKWWISGGWDHMKYKVPHGQLQASGTIDPAWALDAGWAVDTASVGSFANDPFAWCWRDFNFEHSDGLNYIRIALERDIPVLKLSDRGELGVQGMVGAGLMLCRTDLRWFGRRVHHTWTISGYGASASGGVYADYGRIRVLARLQAGFINIAWGNFLLDEGRVQHNFGFSEQSVTLAYVFSGS